MSSIEHYFWRQFLLDKVFGKVVFFAGWVWIEIRRRSGR